MGFFQDLKEDLSQAVNELIPEEELLEQAEAEEVSEEAVQEDIAEAEVVEEATKEAEANEEMPELPNLEEMLAGLAETAEEVAPAEVEAQPEGEPVQDLEAALAVALSKLPDGADTEEKVPVEVPVVEQGEIPVSEPIDVQTEAMVEMPVPAQAETVVETPVVAQMAAPEIPSMPVQNTEEASQILSPKATVFDDEDEVSDEEAQITSGMIINGDLITKGSCEILGTINGNLDVLGKLSMSGTVKGECFAAEIYSDSAQVTGDIHSKGSVKIGAKSVIIGNIFATSAVIAGAVKGDIDVQGPVILDSSAIVMGNIKSKAVQINNGAVIEGIVSQCYAQVSPTYFFDDYKMPEIVIKNRKF